MQTREQEIMITNPADRSMNLLTLDEYSSIQDALEKNQAFQADLKLGRRHILAGYTKPWVFVYNN